MLNDDLSFMIVAGEASGDLHAAKLVRELKKLMPDRVMTFFGSAGPGMREAGVEATVKADELSVVGLFEIGAALPMFARAYRSLTSTARAKRPDAAILIDFPDFNLKLARTLKRAGIPVIYYISPQLWAWRSYRVRTVRKYVDLLITILPFEKEWYERRGVDSVEYVGSPLATEVGAISSKKEFCDLYGFDPDRPIIALLPGSRRKEIARILPIMLEAAGEISSRQPKVQFVIAAAGPEAARQIRTLSGDEFKIVTGSTYDLLNASDAAAVTSGTATLEAGIIGTPMVVVYKTSNINYALLRPLISVEHFGLVNLIAGDRVAKEMIQSGFTARELAGELLRLTEPDVNRAVRERLRKTADKLGHGGASRKAAEAILRLLKELPE